MENKERILSKNKLYWLYFIGFCLILVLPLLNLPPWFSPPDWGKTIVFRVITAVLAFLFVYQIINQQKSGIVEEIRQTPAILPFNILIALFIAFFLATIFSLDPTFSLWGSPYRAGGFVNFAFYIIFAILAFLVIQKKDWRKIWDFAIFIGILVSIVAIFQQFGIFKELFILSEIRPPSTVGGPIFLAIYLSLLSFLTLSFCIKEKKLAKKLFYFLSLLLFFLVAVFITQTRAAIIGFFVSFLYFIFFYPIRPCPFNQRGGANGASPNRKLSISLVLKLIALIVFLSGIYGIYFINTQAELPQFIQENKLLLGVIQRLSIKTALENARVTAWLISWQALKERPILGWGIENFAIGFDQHYDPVYPVLAKEYYIGGWWDRAHSFIFDIGTTAGIPALIIYIALFGALIWQLQKLKKQNPDNAVVYHGIQATFVAYLIANLFSFDTFSTYLISFLLIAYSLSLIRDDSLNKTEVMETHKKEQKNTRKIKGGREILVVLFFVLIWFIWSYNVRPFQINTQINIAKYLVENDKCPQALSRMENILTQRSFLDAYLRLKYSDFLTQCGKKYPEKSLEFSRKGYEIVKENVKIQPYYTRNYIVLGVYTNILIGKTANAIKTESDPSAIQNLKQNLQSLISEANEYFKKANELSPKRQEVYLEWVKTDLLAGEYEKAEGKARKCVDLNPNLADCYWFKGIAQTFRGNFEKAEESIKIAEAKGYPSGLVASQNWLAKAYAVSKNYQKLAEVYERLAKINPNEPFYYSALAAIYKELGNFEKAEENALKVLKLAPESKVQVEEFIKTLK